MTADPQPSTPRPMSFLAAWTALTAIEQAVHAAQVPPPSAEKPGEPEEPPGPDVGSEDALAALLLLRKLRDELAGWETGLIETARGAGASWADLAHPLGVASRQAAERRYLRLRPGAPGTTGEQRVQATRDRRAADRAVTTWARENAADLRSLAGQITAVAGVPAEARRSLTRALGHDDAAGLIGPLADARAHLPADHADLAHRVDALTRHTDRLRRGGDDDRRESPSPTR